MRSFPLAVLAAVLLVSLTACNPFTDPYHEEIREGGVTARSAEQLVASIEGVTAVRFESVEWYSPGEGGMFSSAGVSPVLSVTIDPQWSIADPQGLLEFLAATAWSVNDRFPKGQVVLALTGGVDQVFDWQAVVREVFGNDSVVIGSLQSDVEAAIPESAQPMAINTDAYGERFGRWPSEPVAVPDGLLVNEPPTITIVPAISDPGMHEFELALSDPDCLWVEFTRGRGGLGQYSGEVQAQIVDGSGTDVATIVVDPFDEHDRVCFPEGERPANTRVTLTTTPAEGFTDVTVTVGLD